MYSLLVDVFLDDIHFLAIVKCIFFITPISFPVAIYAALALPDCMIALFLVYSWTTRLFSIMAVIIYSLICTIQDFSPTSETFVLHDKSNSLLGNVYLLVVLLCIFRVLSDPECFSCIYRSHT